jgi:hypothetical protein
MIGASTWIGDLHRKSPAADAEQISINMKAVPSFDAFGRFLQTANPFAFWAQTAWFPGLGAASVMLPLSVEPSKLSQKNTEPGCRDGRTRSLINLLD